MANFDQKWSGAEHSNLGQGTNKNENWKCLKNGFNGKIFSFLHQIKVSNEN